MFGTVLGGVLTVASPVLAQRHEMLKVFPEDGAAREYFGCSTTIDDRVILVGAYGDRSHGFLAGAAYLFDRLSGEQLSRFFPEDGASVDEFGHSVALSGNIATVGAPLHDQRGDNAGTAYVFEISDPTHPVGLAELLTDGPSDGAQFGYALAASGHLAVVSGYRDDDLGERSGSAYVFDISDPAHPGRLVRLLALDGEGPGLSPPR